MKNKYWSDSSKPFLIAEIGGNHEGDLNRALNMIHLASEGGADAVKFQSYTGDSLVNKIIDPVRNEHFKKFTLKIDDQHKLIQTCVDLNVEFMTSIWDENLLKELGPHLNIFKVGSGDLTNLSLIEKIIEFEKPIIISTAMAKMDEIHNTVNFIHKTNNNIVRDDNLCVMQCVAMYGNPQPNYANLKVIETLRREFPGVNIGYSDHTIGFEALLYSYVMGCNVLEFHFTDEKGGEFRDHELSLKRNQLIELKEKLNACENYLGTAQKTPVPEIENTERITEFRRACYLNRDIKKGEVIVAEDIITLRPNVGISALEYYDLIGSTANLDIEALQKLEWSFFDKD